jgi:hypothetical protein
VSQIPDEPERVTNLFTELTQDGACVGNTFAAIRFVELLGQLKAHGVRSPSDFEELCDQLLDCFLPHELEDELIRKNPLTPHAIRYLVGALRAYRVRLNGKKSLSNSPERAKPGERNALLAEVFFASGRAGRPRERWTLDSQTRCLQAAGRAYGDVMDAGGTPLQGHEAALEAAYQAFLVKPEGQESEQERRRNRSQLKSLLIEHGYRPWE